MQMYLQKKYIFAFIFGLVVVYIMNKNVDLLFQSRLVESQTTAPLQAPKESPKQGAIATH